MIKNLQDSRKSLLFLNARILVQNVLLLTPHVVFYSRPIILGVVTLRLLLKLYLRLFMSFLRFYSKNIKNHTLGLGGLFNGHCMQQPPRSGRGNTLGSGGGIYSTDMRQRKHTSQGGQKCNIYVGIGGGWLFGGIVQRIYGGENTLVGGFELQRVRLE